MVASVLRAMMKHAVEIGLRADDPTQDVRAIRVKSDGFHSWTEPRLAFTLLLYTGQRRSDVVRMGGQHIWDGVLQVRQVKTGAELMIPVHAELAKILSEVSGNMTFLTTSGALHRARRN